MTITEICGNFSGFGEQISSKRVTLPKYGIGSSKRDVLPYEKDFIDHLTGIEAPPAKYSHEVALGAQLSSKKTTEPSYSMGARQDDCQPAVHPGPGTHSHAEQHFESAFKVQLHSHRRTQPSTRIPTATRFPPQPKSLRNNTSSGSLWPRPTTGWIGELTPHFSMHSGTRRYDVAKTFPASCPSFLSSPAANYALPSSLGEQVEGERRSCPRSAMPKCPRGGSRKQFVSKAHALVEPFTVTPGPCKYDQVKDNGAFGRKLVSSAGTRPEWGFGSGDRFTQTKSRPSSSSSSRRRNASELGVGEKTLAFFRSPDPGAHRVQ